MQKKITAIFVIALMLASCLVASTAVSDKTDAEDFLVTIAPDTHELEVGETVAIRDTYNTEKMFDDITEYLHKYGPSILDYLYTSFVNALGEPMTKEEFKTNIIATVSSLTEFGIISPETGAFIKDFVQHPSVVELDYDTFVCIFKDLFIFVELYLSLVFDDAPSVSLTEFEFDVDIESIFEITRLGTYQYQLANYTQLVFTFNLIANFGEDTLTFEDAVLSLETMSRMYMAQAPKDVSCNVNSYLGISLTGNSNFIDSNASADQDMFRISDVVKPFDINATYMTSSEFSIYPSMDYPFYYDEGESSVNTILHADVSVDSTTPKIKSEMEYWDFPLCITELKTIPVSVKNSGGMTRIVSDDGNLVVVASDRTLDIVYSADGYLISFSGDLDKTVFDLGLLFDSGEGYHEVSIQFKDGKLKVSVDGEDLSTVDISSIDIDPKKYYGKDLILTDEEVEMLNAEMSAYSASCNNVWVNIPIGDIIHAEFYLQGDTGPIQTEEFIAGSTVSTPGYFVLPGGTIIEDWITEDGKQYKYSERHYDDIVFYGSESILLQSPPEVGELQVGEKYAIKSAEGVIIDVDALTPGAFLSVFDNQYTFIWTLGATEDDDLSDTVLDIHVDKYILNSDVDYVKEAIGDRKSLCLDFAASGAMPTVSNIWLYTQYVFDEGQKLDVYYDDGKSLVPMGTYDVSNAGIEFDVPHCSTYIVVEHVDQPSNMMYIVLGIVIILVLVLAVFFVMKKKSVKN